jgi:hypothetical protein
MGNLWQFFGLPDPEVPAVQRNRRKTSKPKSPDDGTTVQSNIIDVQDAIIVTDESSPVSPISIPKPITRTSHVPKGWNGPLTPDGDPFHDLSHHSGGITGHPDRALRYVSPDKMHRLPLNEITSRIHNGDTIIVDLRSLIHMDTQSNACRRQLKAVGEEMGVAVFSLDASDKLLLLPGGDVTVDVARHELGLAPLLM